MTNESLKYSRRARRPRSNEITHSSVAGGPRWAASEVVGGAPVSTETKARHFVSGSGTRSSRSPRHCDALHLLGQTFFIPPATTTTPGIFAVGDVRAGSVKRVASSVGEGSVVISKVWQYLNG